MTKLDGSYSNEPIDPKVLETLDLNQKVRFVDDYIHSWNLATWVYFKRREELKVLKPYVPYFKTQGGK